MEKIIINKKIKLVLAIFIIFILISIITNIKVVAQSIKDLNNCSASSCGKNWSIGGGRIPGFYIPPVETKAVNTKPGACVLDLNTNISCSGTIATFRWSLSDNPTNQIEAQKLELNSTNLDLPVNATSTSSNVVKGELYRTRVVGVNDGSDECFSDKVSFVCEDSRPTLCQNIQIVNDKPTEQYFEISTTANRSVEKYVYAVFNNNNKDSAGNPKPVCVPAAGGYQGSCPSGSQMLTFYDTYSSKSATSLLKVGYDVIYINDINDSNRPTDKLIIKAFLSDPSQNSGVYADPCEVPFSVSKVGYTNTLPAVNVFNNLGRFRKVGDWTVDMTPPQVNTPVTSNYTYDSFDTEWRLKTDTQIMDMNLGCYNLSSLLSYGVNYLGYLNDQRKYQTPATLFSNLNGSFNFEYKTRSTDANNNIILNPPPFPNCVNLDTLNVFKSKVNQTSNLANGGTDVALKTKYRLENPENFENFQHIFKASDLACNTAVSQPGGAGIPIPGNWISTDGGTVHYSESVASASSPLAPQNIQKIDNNLYCTYDYSNTANSKIFFDDANSDDSILNISKSLLFNDGAGKSYVGAKENSYKAGDDLLLSLYGSNATHYGVLLNEIKSRTDVISHTSSVSNPAINSIADTGCDPASERCYIEVAGDLIINGDDGLPPVNSFCNQNALFFVNGDLTINDSIYKTNNIDSCCGFIVNGDINMTPTNPASGYNKTRYQNDYLSRNNVDWYNTYECSTGFYYAEGDIVVQSDRSNVPMSSSEINLSDPLMIRGDLLAKGNISQQRSNGIGNLSRPAVYLTKDSCIMNNFPELSYVLLKTRERDFITDN